MSPDYVVGIGPNAVTIVTVLEDVDHQRRNFQRKLRASAIFRNSRMERHSLQAISNGSQWLGTADQARNTRSYTHQLAMTAMATEAGVVM